MHVAGLTKSFETVLTEMEKCVAAPPASARPCSDDKPAGSQLLFRPPAAASVAIICASENVSSPRACIATRLRSRATRPAALQSCDRPPAHRISKTPTSRRIRDEDPLLKELDDKAAAQAHIDAMRPAEDRGDGSRAVAIARVVRRHAPPRRCSPKERGRARGVLHKLSPLPTARPALESCFSLSSPNTTVTGACALTVPGEHGRRQEKRATERSSPLRPPAAGASGLFAQPGGDGP